MLTVSVCELICTLLSWFRGLCSPGMLHPLWNSILLRKQAIEVAFSHHIVPSFSVSSTVAVSVARGMQPLQSALEHSHEPKSSFHCPAILPPYPQVSVSSSAYSKQPLIRFCLEGTGKTNLSKHSPVMVVAVRVCWICWKSMQFACDWLEDCVITGMLTTCRKVLFRHRHEKHEVYLSHLFYLFTWVLLTE